MKKLEKRYLRNPNTVESYACMSGNCVCNPAYCSGTWSDLVPTTAARVFENDRRKKQPFN